MKNKHGFVSTWIRIQPVLDLCIVDLFMFYRFRLLGMFAIVAVLMGASFITTAVIFAHFHLAATMLGAAAQAER